MRRRRIRNTPDTRVARLLGGAGYGYGGLDTSRAGYVTDILVVKQPP